MVRLSVIQKGSDCLSYKKGLLSVIQKWVLLCDIKNVLLSHHVINHLYVCLLVTFDNFHIQPSVSVAVYITVHSVYRKYHLHTQSCTSRDILGVFASLLDHLMVRISRGRLWPMVNVL